MSTEPTFEITIEELDKLMREQQSGNQFPRLLSEELAHDENVLVCIYRFHNEKKNKYLEYFLVTDYRLITKWALSGTAEKIPLEYIRHVSIYFDKEEGYYSIYLRLGKNTYRYIDEDSFYFAQISPDPLVIRKIQQILNSKSAEAFVHSRYNNFKK